MEYTNTFVSTSNLNGIFCPPFRFVGNFFQNFSTKKPFVLSADSVFATSSSVVWYRNFRTIAFFSTSWIRKRGLWVVHGHYVNWSKVEIKFLSIFSSTIDFLFNQALASATDMSICSTFSVLSGHMPPIVHDHSVILPFSVWERGEWPKPSAVSFLTRKAVKMFFQHPSQCVFVCIYKLCVWLSTAFLHQSDLYKKLLGCGRYRPLIGLSRETIYSSFFYRRVL